ncbi:hypothetical protein ACHAPV_003892 [Trichoderma viride]
MPAGTEQSCGSRGRSPGASARPLWSSATTVIRRPSTKQMGASRRCVQLIGQGPAVRDPGQGRLRLKSERNDTSPGDGIARTAGLVPEAWEGRTSLARGQVAGSGLAMLGLEVMKDLVGSGPVKLWPGR